MRLWFLLAIASLAFAAFLFGCSDNPVSGASSNTQQKDTTKTISSDTSAARIAALKAAYVALTDSTMNAVAAFRGKPFLQPVIVSAYTQAEYAPIAAASNQPVPLDQQEQYNAVLVCEGLMHPNQDYFAGYDSIMSEETGGFYEPGTDSIVVVIDSTSSGPTFDDSITLFHELIHAMQDQYHNLTKIEENAITSDQDFATRSVIEGEAELSEYYYAYKLTNGHYPSTDAYIVSEFNLDQAYADFFLDSIHLAGQPLIEQMPFNYYYTYGPLFIDAIVDMNWSLIDSKIFASLPYRSFETMQPSLYGAQNEYLLDMGEVEKSMDSAFITYDVDDFGEINTSVLFREWNFSSYKTLSQGLLADELDVARDLRSDTLRMAWSTYWQDSTKAATFLTNYAGLVNLKKSIALPAPVTDSGRTVINDTLNKVYIEQDSTQVFVFENYPAASLNFYVNELRGVRLILRGNLAKTAAATKRYPRINKTMLIKGQRNLMRGHLFQR